MNQIINIKITLKSLIVFKKNEQTHKRIVFKLIKKSSSISFCRTIENYIFLHLYEFINKLRLK